MLLVSDISSRSLYGLAQSYEYSDLDLNEL